MPGESDKKTWEKERRGRLKEGFIKLEKLLPSYDPSIVSTRINILNKSIEYIQEMQNRVDELLKPNSNINTEVLQLKKLQERIKRLISRNELLSSLLREAKISIPNQGSTLKTFKYGFKWSGKISEKMATGVQKKTVIKNEKENKSGTREQLKRSEPNKKMRNKLNSSSLVPKHRKSIVNRAENSNRMNMIKKLSHPVSTNCFIIYTQACNTQPCYLVTSAPSNNFVSLSQTVITNSLVTSSPVMSTSIKASKKAVIQSTLGTSTLILANGTLYPVLPQSQPITPTQMIFQVANNSTVNASKPQSIENLKRVSEANESKIGTNVNINDATSSGVDKIKNLNDSKECSIVSSSTSLNTSVNSTVTLSAKDVILSRNIAIRPSMCVTKTTHVNKVPIPALTSSFGTSILVPETSKTTALKKNVNAKRIGNRPMGRQALRKLRKMVSKRKIEMQEETIKNVRSKSFMEKVDKKSIQKNTLIEKSNLNSTLSVTTNFPVKTVNTSPTLALENNQSVQNSQINCIQNIDQKSSSSNIQLDGEQYKIPIITNDVIKVPKNRQISFTTNSSTPGDICLQSTHNEYDKNYQETNLSENNCSDLNKNSLNNGNNSKTSVANLNTQHSSLIEQPDEDNGIKNHNLMNSESNSTKLIRNINSSAPTYTGDVQNKLSTQNIQITKKEKNVKLDDNTQNFLENHETIENNNQRNDNSLNVENVCNLNQQIKNFDLQLGNSELSNDIFDSLQVPPGCQNPESTSPTAAFLLAFPLVSSLTGVKVTEVMDDDNPDSQRETPTLLQIGTLDNTKPTPSPNLFNLDNLSFFSSKDIYNGFYNSFEQHLNALTMSTNTFVNDSSKATEKSTVSTCLPKVGKTEEHIKVSNNQTIQKGKKSCIIENSKNSSATTTTIDEQPNIAIDKEVHKNLNKINDPIIQQPNANSLDISTQKLSVTTNLVRQNIQNTPVQANLLNENDNFSNNKTVENLNKNVKHDTFIPIKGNPHSGASKNIESNKFFNSDIVAPIDKIVDQNLFHNFNMKRDNFVTPTTQTSTNVFNIDSRNSQLPAAQKNVEQTYGNFLPQKQNFILRKNFDGQICSQVANIQPLMQNNLQNAQLSFGDNRNLVPITSQSNFGYNLFSMDSSIPSCLQKNVNYKNLNCNSEDKYSGLQKDYNRTFFTSEMLPPLKDINNAESMDVENRMNEASQKNIYNNQLQCKNAIPVSVQKAPDINFSFNLGNVVPPPIPKTIESKQLFPNYNMPDTNINYDLNGITKVCTCVYSMNKKFPDPLYTNSNNSNYNYYSNSENFLNENCFKNTKIDKVMGSIDFENFNDYRKTDYSNTYYHDHNFQKNIVASTKSNNHNEKVTYNWMTAPSKNSLEQTIASFPKEDIAHSSHNILNNNQTTYFNAPLYTGEINSNLGHTTRKNLELPLMNANTNLQRNDIEDNHFTWSPSKIPQFLDPVPNFVSSTLPTLVGDLALGTASYTEQKLESSSKYPNHRDVKNKPTSKFNYENQSNLFSVSQLVHQNKEIVPAKPTRRRSSGSGSKGNAQKNKKASKLNEDQKEIQCFTKSPINQNHGKSDKNLNCRQSNNIFCDLNKRNPVKTSSSNYTAEALIGNQGNSDVISKREHLYTSTVKNMPVPPFMSDNIMPYFPAVDMPQDNYIQQNQNYQNFTHNFTTFPNTPYTANTFIPSCTISTTYLSTNTFMPDLGSGHDFQTSNMNLFSNAGLSKDNKTKNISKSNTNGREEKNTHNNQFPSNVGKKGKRKATNESSLTPNLVDFTFLSVSGNINSPLLPDDFHSHSTFLPPPPTQPQLYPCKNTIYSTKQSSMNSVAPLLPLPPIPSVARTGIQHPEVSPSLNSGGTSLTNFNLSTIFPEINKGSINEIYSDNRVKEHPVTTHYPNSSVSTEF